MFKNLFKRVKALPAKPVMQETGTAVPSDDDTYTESPPKTFREKWEERWETGESLPTPDVSEGNGGNTEWGMWTDAVEKLDEEVSFAATVPMPLNPK